MDIEINSIRPNQIEFEGFYYLEFEGDFFKGCKRCGGEGHYSHNGEHSRCYECDNTSAKLGQQLESRAAAEKWCHERAVRRLQRERKAEAERMKKVNQMLAHQADLKAADEEVFNFLMQVVIEEDTQDQYPTYEEWALATGGDDNSKLEKNSFLRSMAETLRWVAPARAFSPKMIAAVRTQMEKRTEQAIEAAAHPAPSGRVAVTGEITSAKIVENDFGTTYKILVKDDAGFKVWCSIPKAQADEAHDDFLDEVKANGNSIYDFGTGVWFLGTEGDKYNGIKGRRITFTATLEPSQDDISFAFGKRPTKGAWL